MPSQSDPITSSRINHDEEVPREALNRAFRYGDGLFETLLVRDGKAWKLEAHLERMLNGMGILGFEFDPKSWRERMIDLTQRLIKTKHRGEFSRIRIQVYRGGGGKYRPETNVPEYVAELTPLPNDPWSYNKRLKIGVFHEVQLLNTSLSAVKSCSALPYVVAARYAQQQGWDDAILRSVQGHIAETSCANIFVLRHAQVLTPALKAGCIPGIMRKTLLEIARASGFQVVERAVYMRDLTESDDILLTNVIRGLQPVGSIAGKEWTPAKSSARNDLLRLIRERS
ncbi:MAG: aminotransferase class IV [Bacteroidota bacterium]